MQGKKSKCLQLAQALGSTIKKYRINVLGKTMSKLADEYELRSGTLCKVEKADGAAKLETIWQIAEAMNIKTSELIKLVEEELGDDFKLMDE